VVTLNSLFSKGSRESGTPGRKEASFKIFLRSVGELGSFSGVGKGSLILNFDKLETKELMVFESLPIFSRSSRSKSVCPENFLTSAPDFLQISSTSESL